MSLFAIADTHLSLSADKPMDIFNGWSDHVQRLEKNWRAVVSDGDTVVIPGDVSWAMSLEGAQKDFAFLDSLPGKKILMKGNHDYWWNTTRKMENFFKEKGFETLSIVHNSAVPVGNISVCGTRGWFFDAEEDADKKVLLREAGRLRTSIEKGIALGGEPVVFLHYPPITQDRICPEIYDVLVEYKIKRCFYGHLHSFATKSAFEGERDGIKFSLISGDHLEFLPKLIEKQP